MQVRRSEPRDFEEIMAIYGRARMFMAETGNPHQWGDTSWPPEELIRADIAAGNSYVCTEDGKICAVFYFLPETEDPTYARIYDGAWKYPGPYGVVHRVAASGTVKGAGAFALNWAFAQCGHLRMDTHGDNKVMQKLLAKLGFEYCGIIYVEEDSYPRLAYERDIEKDLRVR